MRAFFKRLSWRWLLPLAILAGVAPWPIGPEPHLVQKVVYLIEGNLSRPIDIFDLVFHASPALLLAGKLFVEWSGDR
jgi:hypothetical protein